jgi:hypothetical protein
VDLMARQQPLRGSSAKMYDVITNFNKGIDKKAADDMALDSSFKNLKNFYNAEEGYLSKRPSVYNSHLFDFIRDAMSTHPNTIDTEKFVLVKNKFGEYPIDYKLKINDFINTVIDQKQKEANKIVFNPDKIVGFQVFENNAFMEMLQDYRHVLLGWKSDFALQSDISFGAIIVTSGTYGYRENAEDPINYKRPLPSGLHIARIKINVKVKTNPTSYECSMEYDSVDPTVNPYANSVSDYHSRWDFLPEIIGKSSIAGLVDNDKVPAASLDLTSFNGATYIATGTNYIIKIEQDPKVRVTEGYKAGECNIITKIGGDENENIYQPTPIEVQQVGFNLLSNKPLEDYKNDGTAVKVKGTFFTIPVEKDGESFLQPTLNVPYNDDFNLHIVYTGSKQPETPQFRPSTGDTDETTNPYKDLPGTWADDTKKVWKCTGVDNSQTLEIKISLDEDTFLVYAVPTSVPISEEGYINVLNDLVFSSTHSKVIDDRLVLYGNHGYMFYSDVTTFNYFPNYNFAYLVSEAGEETITSITYFRQFYAIFTNKKIKRLAGTLGDPETMGIYPLSDFIGCPNGRTVRMVGNNLLFLGNDGIYKLKQGYLGEGTENIEKVDEALDSMLNLSNVLQAFVMNNNYVIVLNDGKTWIVCNTQTNAFYEYNLESFMGQVYEGKKLDETMASVYLPFHSIFQSTVYDTNGDFFLVPMYNYEYVIDNRYAEKTGIDMMMFRFNDLDFLEADQRHKDGYGFISTLETHLMNMGYPTHTKKFKEVYIKWVNESGHALPLYVTIIVDDTVVVSPESYEVVYNEETDTYTYKEIIRSNGQIVTDKVLGELILGQDIIGKKTVQQLKIKVGAKGRSIKLIISDGIDDYIALLEGETPQRGVPKRIRNKYDFSLASIGIVYKLKKVREG